MLFVLLFVLLRFSHWFMLIYLKPFVKRFLTSGINHSWHLIPYEIHCHKGVREAIAAISLLWAHTGGHCYRCFIIGTFLDMVELHEFLRLKKMLHHIAIKVVKFHSFLFSAHFPKRAWTLLHCGADLSTAVWSRGPSSLEIIHNTPWILRTWLSGVVWLVQKWKGLKGVCTISYQSYENTS